MRELDIRNRARQKAAQQEVNRNRSIIMDALKHTSTPSVEGPGALAGLSAVAGPMAVGLVATGAAALYAGKSFLTMGIDAMEARANLVTVFDALGEMESSGTDVVAMLDRLSDKFGRTREEMATSTKAFMSMGIRDIPTLRKSVEAASAAFGLMGETAESEFVSIMARAQQAKEAGIGLILPRSSRNGFAKMGIDLAEVAKKMNMSAKDLSAGLKSGGVDAQQLGDALQTALLAKGAGAIEKLSNRVTPKLAIIKQKFRDMFEGVNIKPIIDGLNNLLGMLDQNTAAGSVFGDMLRKAFNWVSSIVGSLINRFLLLTYDIEIVYLSFSIFYDKMVKLFDEGKWFGMGMNAVKGLIQGVEYMLPDWMKTSGKLSELLLAITNHNLDSHSPSQAMAEIGRNAVLGFTQGYDRESDKTEVGSMVTGGISPAAFIPPSSAPTQSGGSGTTEVNVHLDVHLSGTSPSAVAQQLTEEAVSLVFERMALAQGL